MKKRYFLYSIQKIFALVLSAHSKMISLYIWSKSIYLAVKSQKALKILINKLPCFILQKS